ncbi:MAG: cupin domain-containing protein [Terriglobales bacterium]
MRRCHALLVVVLFALNLTAQTPLDVEITSEPHHHLALQNKYVRAFKVEVAPHAATLMHRHRHDYVYVVLGAAHVENDVAGKPPVTITLQGGETHFLSAGLAHMAKNLSDQPFRIIIIELMQDEKARPSPPPKWDEERGLHILNGGTEDILFVKDGARASELQLQPGGVLPKHRHAGPYLVVAVTDLDLRSDVEGRAASKVQLKAGDILWEKGGLTHKLTNVGKQNAKLITLEFP